MGLAAYGEPRFADEFARVYDVRRRSSARGSTTSRSTTAPPPPTSSRRCSGARPRTRAGPFARRRATAASRLRRRRRQLQDVTERALALAREAPAHGLDAPLPRRRGGAQRVANRRMLDEGPFEQLFVQPAAGDAGGRARGRPLRRARRARAARRVPLEHAYSDATTAGARSPPPRGGRGVEYRELRRGGAARRDRRRLAAGEVVGWFQGRFEWGPRALGQPLDPRRRAPARDEGAHQREDQVPRAVPALRAGGDGGRRGAASRPSRRAQHPARFMLLICELDPARGPRSSRRSNHFGTARLQTVREEWNPAFFRLLERWVGRRRAARPAEHVVQPPRRADRHHPAKRAEHLHAQRPRPARARELRGEEEEGVGKSDERARRPGGGGGAGAAASRVRGDRPRVLADRHRDGGAGLRQRRRSTDSRGHRVTRLGDATARATRRRRTPRSCSAARTPSASAPPTTRAPSPPRSGGAPASRT